MNPFKRLAGETAIYGLSNIIGRVINFLLVPLYTRVFIPGEYGVVTEMYVYVAFLLIVLTYGMETALFRFSLSSPDRKDTVFSTSLFLVLCSSSLFILFVVLFRQPIAEAMRYPDNVEYILLLGSIVGLDAIAAIPYARLRAENRPWRFAITRLTGIAVNILLVLFFLLLCPWLIEHGPERIKPLIHAVYNPDIGVGYVFIANLAATIITLLMLMPVMRTASPSLDKALLKSMLVYALPLLVAGMAGWINEALDKLLLKYLLPESIALQQVGIYGAVYKLAMMMTLFIQAFRFSAEPFFFAQATQKNARELFAGVMNYFVITCLLIFLGIMLYIDIFKHFIGPRFHEGLAVVPILLLANMFLGIYWNLSIWYKLTSKTLYGAGFAIAGALITITLNIWWIPYFGYHGSAWATLVCYFCLAGMSYLFGRKHYKIPYRLPRLVLVIVFALGIYFISFLTSELQPLAMYAANTGLLIAFLLGVLITDSSLRTSALQTVRNILHHMNPNS